MPPWLHPPSSASGILTPAELDFVCLLRMTIWLVFIPAVAVLIVVMIIGSSRTEDVKEGSEMETGVEKGDGEEKMRVRTGSGRVGVWRGE